MHCENHLAPAAEKKKKGLHEVHFFPDQQKMNVWRVSSL